MIFHERRNDMTIKSMDLKKAEKAVIIIQLIFCLLNISCLFFGIMSAFGGGNTGYSIFRSLCLTFSIPAVVIRIAYMQYIIFGAIAVFDVFKYASNIKNKRVSKKYLLADIALWIITIFELIFLEDMFYNIMRF